MHGISIGQINQWGGELFKNVNFHETMYSAFASLARTARRQIQRVKKYSAFLLSISERPLVESGRSRHRSQVAGKVANNIDRIIPFFVRGTPTT